MTGTADGKALTPGQRVAWLRLIRTDNVGPVTFRQLLNRCGSAEEAIAALPRLIACDPHQPVIVCIADTR